MLKIDNNNKKPKTMKARVRSHVGCCYLIATTKTSVINTKQKKVVTTKVTNKAIFKPAYLTSSEKKDEEHFRELMKLKKAHKYNIFKD